MGRGTWSRWGRNGCEGYSLAFGDLVTGSVVRKSDGTWEASIGTVPLELPRGTTRAEAMKLIEHTIEAKMRFALEEWNRYLQWKASTQRPPSDPDRGNPQHKA